MSSDNRLLDCDSRHYKIEVDVKGSMNYFKDIVLITYITETDKLGCPTETMLMHSLFLSNSTSDSWRKKGFIGKQPIPKQQKFLVTKIRRIWGKMGS